MNTEALAKAIVAANHRIADAERPIDRRLAVAELGGMFKAASALNLAMTPFAVELALSEAILKAGSRPHFRFTGSVESNQPARDWDEKVATMMALALGWDDI